MKQISVKPKLNTATLAHKARKALSALILVICAAYGIRAFLVAVRTVNEPIAMAITGFIVVYLVISLWDN